MASYISFTRDPNNPGMAIARTADGGTETVPLDVAQQSGALPLDAGMDPAAAPMGPPPPPAVLPPDAAGAPQPLPMAAPGGAPGDVPRTFSGPAEMAPVPDAQSQAIEPDMLGQFQHIPATVTPVLDTVTTQNVFPASPEERLAAFDETQALQFGAGREGIDASLDAERASLVARDDSLTKRITGQSVDPVTGQLTGEPGGLTREVAERDAQIEEMQRIQQITAQTPISEADFWGPGVGRRIMAGLAVALGGIGNILMGRPGADNPVMGIINRSIDNFLRAQMEAKSSTLAHRGRMLGDLKQAQATAKLQLLGLVERQLDTQAQLAALDAKGDAAYQQLRANLAAARGQVEQQIYAQAQGQVQRRVDQKLTAAQSPMQQMIRKLAPGVPPGKELELWQEATGTGAGQGDLLNKVEVVDRVRELATRLRGLVGEDGHLPTKEGLTLDRFAPFRELMARWDWSEESKKAVQEKNYMAAIQLEMKRALNNTRLVDSNLDAQGVAGILDAGDTATTMAALEQFVNQADGALRATASRYFEDPATAIDFARNRMRHAKGTSDVLSRGRPVGQAPPARPAVGADGVPEAIRAPAPAPEPVPEPPESLRRDDSDDLVGAVQQHASAAGLNPDAMLTAIGPESGGKADAKNPLSSAAGIFQATDSTARALGYESARDLASRPRAEQAEAMVRYFAKNERLKQLGDKATDVDYYMAIAAPAAVGAPMEQIVYKRGTEEFKANAHTWGATADEEGIRVRDIVRWYLKNRRGKVS
jgi:hypothetical protein